MDEKELYAILAKDLGFCNFGNCAHKKLNLLYAISQLVIMDFSSTFKQDLSTLKIFMAKCTYPNCLITKNFLIDRFLKRVEK